MKEETCWAIYTDGMLLPFLIRSTRRQAIGDAMERIDGRWSYMRRRGYSVRKVIVIPHEKKP